MECSSNKSGVARNISEQSVIVAFKRNKNLQEIIGGHTIKNGKVSKAHSKNRKGKCEPCNTSKPSLCCKQVIDTSTFRSYQTQQLYTIFHKLNCKSKFIIYLMECALCKVQYIEKAETTFNIKLNYFYSNYIHKMPGNTDFYLLTIF